MGVNHLRATEFGRRFKKETKPVLNDQWPYNQLDFDQLLPLLGVSKTDCSAAFPGYWELVNVSLENRQFAYCKECLALGYHSVFHEVSWTHRCPIHGSELLTQCWVCDRSVDRAMPYLLGGSANTFACGHGASRSYCSKDNAVDFNVFQKLAKWHQKIVNTETNDLLAVVTLNSFEAKKRESVAMIRMLALLCQLNPPPYPILDPYVCKRHAGRTLHSLAVEDFHPDWFEFTLQEARALVDHPDYLVPWLKYINGSLCQAVDHYRQLGKEAFVQAVNESLVVVPISTTAADQSAFKDIPPEFYACVFLRKHLVDNCDYSATKIGNNYDAFSWWKRILGEPLGLMRARDSTFDVYWHSIGPIGIDTFG